MKYFLHDTNSFQDEKVTELFIEYGYEGLGLFYTILEKLAMQEKPIKTVVLKKQLSIGKKLEKVWSFMEGIELIYSNNGETFNENILKFSEKYQIKKEKTKKRVSQWRENQVDIENVTCYNDVRNSDKVKESKVKESKVIDSFNSVVEKPTTLTQPEIKIPEVLSSSSLTDEEREKEKSSAKKEKPKLEESADGSFVCLELRAMIVEFRKEKKGLYTDEMYKAFALHWSEPNGRGVPKWMVTKKKSGTFHLPGRLAKWNENDYDNKTKLTDGKSKQRNGGPLRSTAKAQPVYRGKGSTLNVEL